MNTSELQKIKQRYNIVGNNNNLNRALDVALQVAPTDLSVLIVGESGVGKEIIPRVIHDAAERSILQSTVEPSLKVLSTVSCSVMRKAHIPVPSEKVRDISVWATKERSSSMR